MPSLDIPSRESISDFEHFRYMYGLKKEYDLVIVGAGLSGAVIAQQAEWPDVAIFSQILAIFRE